MTFVNFLKKRVLRSTSLPAFLLFLIMAILNICITTGFLSKSYINSFFGANAPLICLAIGVSMVLITGGIDLSVGAIICLCNVTMITLFGKGFGVPSAAVCLLDAQGLGRPQRRNDPHEGGHAGLGRDGL